jgi:hypothetical protein
MNAEAVLDSGVYDGAGFYRHSIIRWQQFGKAGIPLQLASEIDTRGAARKEVMRSACREDDGRECWAYRLQGTAAPP